MCDIKLKCALPCTRLPIFSSFISYSDHRRNQQRNSLQTLIVTLSNVPIASVHERSTAVAMCCFKRKSHYKLSTCDLKVHEWINELHLHSIKPSLLKCCHWNVVTETLPCQSNRYLLKSSVPRVFLDEWQEGGCQETKWEPTIQSDKQDLKRKLTQTPTSAFP